MFTFSKETNNKKHHFYCSVNTELPIRKLLYSLANNLFSTALLVPLLNDEEDDVAEDRLLDPSNPKALAPAADDDLPESRSLESNSPKQLSSAGDDGDDAVVYMPTNMVK